MKHVLNAVGLLIAAFVFASGCAAPPPSAGPAFKGGELVSVEKATLDRTWDASQAAFKELALLGEAKTKDSLAASMEATGAGDRNIWLKLRSRGEAVTEVRIRVGVFGDETYSRKILETIKNHL